MTDGQYDFIVVGAGSAGCALANRLSADPANAVLLLETGGKDRNPWIHVPAGFYRNIFNPKMARVFETEPEPTMGGRRLKWPRGRVIGGTSSINGLIYIRGQREDFDLWRQMGNAGWSYDDVLPYFRRAEDQERGANDYHGAGGPLSVSDLRAPHELHDAFIAGAKEAGFPFNQDFNGDTQEGVGTYQLTIRGRRRCSAAVAYLHPAAKRANLRVMTGVHVRRILLEDRQAVGVELAEGTMRARRDIILCAGAVNSPQLLELSGIGDPAVLEAAGVPIAHALPGVGENLQDHIGVRMIERTRRRNTVNDIARSPTRSALTGLRYLVQGQGALMMGAGPLGLFARTRPELASPDLQFHFLIASAASAGGAMHDFPGCTLVASPCRPESRGSIHVTSPDPAAPPAIRANYLATAEDRRVAVEGVKIGRRILATPAMRALLAEEMLPGPAVQSDAEILDYIQHTAGSSFHPTSTCSMGPHGRSVVDHELRVHGIGGLRVADASIMPTLVSGNTNAASIMIGEKAADLVLGKRAA